jgi:intein/homing endonuclease
MKTDFVKSWKDELDSITLPAEMTEDLAEFIGVVVGDGHVESRNRFRYGRWQKVYEIGITGNLHEYEYYERHVNPLIRRLFNVNFTLTKYPKRTASEMKKNSRLIHSYLVKNFKIPSRKNNMPIPQMILSSEVRFQKAFLRGYFDADGCLKFQNRTNIYPIISLASASKNLAYQTSKMLKEMDIENHVSKDIKKDTRTKKQYVVYHLYINGFTRVKRFLKEVGFSNKFKKNTHYHTELKEVFELLGI